MSTLANRFENLDKALDIGFKNVNDIVDNKIYSIRTDIVDKILDFNMKGMEILGNIVNNVQRTIDVIRNIPEKVMRNLQGIYDKVIGAFKSMVDSIWGKGLLGFLNNLGNMGRDIFGRGPSGTGSGMYSGVGAFLMNAANMGSVVLCGNLDVLKDLNEGYLVDVSILEGLFFNLAAEWLDRVCKDIPMKEQAGMTLDEILETSFPYVGTPVELNSVVGEFISLAGSLDNYNNILATAKGSAYSDGWLLNNLTNHNYKEIYRSMIPFKDRNSYAKTLDNLIEVESKLQKQEYLSNRYINTTNLLGLLQTSVPIDPVIKTAYDSRPLNEDALGSLIRNMDHVELSAVARHKLDDNQNQVLDLLTDVRDWSNRGDNMRRGHRSGDWQGGRLNEVLDMFDRQLLDYMVDYSKLNPSEYATRFNGLHPTTGVFLENSNFRPATRQEVPMV